MLAVLTATGTQILAAALVPLTFAALVPLGRWLRRRQGVQLGLAYQLFAIAFSLYLPVAIFGTKLFQQPARPSAAAQSANPDQLKALHAQLRELETALESARTALTPPTSAVPFLKVEEITRHLTAACALLGTLVGLALVRRYFWEFWFRRTHESHPPKFLSQLLGMSVFAVALLIIITTIYGKDLTGLVFGSTVVVGIIGFAMQDLLGNIIAGIALELGKPFKTGDWLLIDKINAEVVEVNWRSTRLRTTDDVYLDIPNKTIVGATITNFTHPNRQHALRIRVGFDYQAAPNTVRQTLIQASAQARGVLKTPPPKVFLSEFGDSAIVYEIKFWIDNQAAFNDICDAIRTNIWYEAQRAGLRIPFPIRTLQIERPQRRLQEDFDALRVCAAKHPLLQLLSREQAESLLHTAHVVRFGAGETIIDQGSAGDSMFILLAGECIVSITANQVSRTVATLKDGDYFGEMSLLTGEPRNATILAKSDCKMWRIGKTDLAPIFQENKELAARLSSCLATRRMETEGVLASSSPNPEISDKRKQYTEGILSKLYSFFEL
jgi:small-conductance mechanosensitive channel